MKDTTYKAEAMEESDWPAVEVVYVEGIATGNATFELASPGWERWNESHLPFGRLVVRDDHDILGWAAVSPVSSRCVYAGVAEVSVYVAESARGKGVGRVLLHQLINECESHGIWTLQAGILTENRASLALHKTCGFREVGYRERLGKLQNQWRDVVLLERRSATVGVD